MFIKKKNQRQIMTEKIENKRIKWITGLFVLLIVGVLFSATKSSSNALLNTSFHPGQLWFDTDSVPINAHGGGILFHEGCYYWFGEFKTAGRRGNTALKGISCYSSTDLYNWKNEGIVLSPEEDPMSDISKGCVMERPKVVFNEKTQKFIIWFHLELKGQGYKAARTAVAISDKVAGPYTYIRSTRVNPGQWPMGFTDQMKSIQLNDSLEWWTPEWRQAVKNGLFVKRDFDGGQMSRDMGLFVDDDGTAYHIHSSEENLTLHISELTSDYTNFTGKWLRVAPAGHREAPAIFKRKGKYYLITSGCTGWDPNAASIAVADSIWGNWTFMGNPCRGENADLTFYSQSTFVLPVNGSADGYIFMADRWKPRNPIDGRYVWLPISFENDQPIIQWADNWDLSVFKNFR